MLDQHIWLALHLAGCAFTGKSAVSCRCLFCRIVQKVCLLCICGQHIWPLIPASTKRVGSVQRRLLRLVTPVLNLFACGQQVRLLPAQPESLQAGPSWKRLLHLVGSLGLCLHAFPACLGCACMAKAAAPGGFCMQQNELSFFICCRTLLPKLVRGLAGAFCTVASMPVAPATCLLLHWSRCSQPHCFADAGAGLGPTCIVTAGSVSLRPPPSPSWCQLQPSGWPSMPACRGPHRAHSSQP